MTSDSQPARRGRPRRLSREQFIAAGEQLATARRADGTPRTLRELLGIPLNAVLEEVGRDEDTAVSPPLLYTHWPNYEDFLQSVMEAVYDPAKKLPTDHLTDRFRTVEERLRAHAALDLEQADQDASLYFGLFAGIENSTIHKVLSTVYRTYETQVLDPFKQVLRDDGRRVRPAFGEGDEGVLALLRALTALAEGFAARRLVQPLEERDPQLIGEAALAIYRQFTETTSPQTRD